LHFANVSQEQHFVNKSGPKNTSCVSNGCNKTTLLETSFLFAWISLLEFHQNIGSLMSAAEEGRDAIPPRELAPKELQTAMKTRFTHCYSLWIL